MPVCVLEWVPVQALYSALPPCLFLCQGSTNFPYAYEPCHPVLLLYAERWPLSYAVRRPRDVPLLPGLPGLGADLCGQRGGRQPAGAHLGHASQPGQILILTLQTKLIMLDACVCHCVEGNVGRASLGGQATDVCMAKTGNQFRWCVKAKVDNSCPRTPGCHAFAIAFSSPQTPNASQPATPMEEDEEGGGAAVATVAEPPSYVEVVDSYPNLGPIVDFAVMDLDRQGQGQVGEWGQGQGQYGAGSG